MRSLITPLFLLLALVLLTTAGAKRVEVKTSKDRNLNRHLNKQQAPSDSAENSAQMAEQMRKATQGRPSQPGAQHAEAVPSASSSRVANQLDEKKRETPGDSERKHSTPPAAPNPEVPNLSSPSKPKKSFFSGLVSSMFGAGDDVAGGAELVAGIEGVSTKVPTADLSQFNSDEEEKKRQIQLHKYKQEMASLEAKNLKEIHDEYEKKKSVANADVNVLAVEYDAKLVVRHQTADAGIAAMVAQQQVALKDIEMEEKEKLRQLDEEVERKRIATDAVMHQSIKLKELEATFEQRHVELEATFEQRHAELNVLERKRQAEAEERKKAIDDLIAQRLVDYEKEIEIRNAAADTLVRAREVEVERRLVEVEKVELDRLRQCDAEVQRMMAEADLIIDARHEEVHMLAKQMKEYEAVTLADIEAKMQATRRINETIINEIKSEIRMKTKEMEVIEQQRKVQFEDEIEKRRLVINELIEQVEGETKVKRKIAEEEIAQQLKQFEFELQRRRIAMDTDEEEANLSILRKLSNISDYEAQRTREVDEEIHQKRVAADALFSRLDMEIEARRRSIMAAEEARFIEFDEELKRRRDAMEEILRGLEDQSDIEKKQMALKLEAERVRQFEFNMLRRKKDAEAEMSDLGRQMNEKRRHLDDVEDQRIRAIDNEIMARRVAVEAELAAAENVAKSVRRETEEYRATSSRAIEEETVNQRKALSEMVNMLEHDYARREKALMKNETLRLQEFEKEYNEKRAEVHAIMVAAEHQRQQHIAEFKEEIEHEMTTAVKALREVEVDIEKRKLKLVELESASDSLISEKLVALEQATLQRRGEVEVELQHARLAAEVLVQTAQAEAEQIRHECIGSLSQEIESNLVTSLKLERQQILLRVTSLEFMLSNETRKVRGLEYEKSRWEIRYAALQKSVSQQQQQRADLKADNLKCSLSYQQLKGSVTERLLQMMSTEDAYHSLSIELKSCQLDRNSVSNDSSLMQMKNEYDAEKSRMDRKLADMEQRALLGEQKLAAVEADFGISKKRCEEVKTADIKRISGLESELSRSLLDKTACEMVGRASESAQTQTSDRLTKELERLLGVEKDENAKLEAELFQCNAFTNNCNVDVSQGSGKIHDLELSLRRANEAKHACEMSKAGTLDAKVVRDLEIEKGRVEAKLKEHETLFVLEANKMKDEEKSHARCKSNFKELQKTYNNLKHHVADLAATHKGCDTSSVYPAPPDYEPPHDIGSTDVESIVDNLFGSLWTSVLDSSEFSKSVAAAGENLFAIVVSNWVLISLAIVVPFSLWVVWKVLSCCARPFVSSTDPVISSARPSPFQQSTAPLAEPRHVNSSQSRIFGQMHSQSATRLGPQSPTGGSQSALVGRIQRIMKQDDETNNRNNYLG